MLTLNKSYFTIILVLIAAVGIIGYLKMSDAYMQPVGELKFDTNDQLASNVTTYMETATDSLHQGNYRCSNRVYGYDNQYAYAWVFCASYVSGLEGSVTQTSASSVATRLEYTGSDFKITSYAQPHDGDLYQASLKTLFPKQMYATAINQPTHEIDILTDESLLRARAYARPNEASSYRGDFNNDDIIDIPTLLITETPTLGTKATLRINDSVVIVPGNNPQGFTTGDFDTSDELMEIAVPDTGPSSDHTTSFYAYDGENIIFMGTVPDLAERMIFNGKGEVTVTARANILDTWFYQENYRLRDDHTLERVPQTFYDRLTQDWPITVISPITLQKSPTDQSSAMTLQTGDKVSILGCDDVEWCQIMAADGLTTGWFAVENFNIIKGTGQPASDFFDGLSYAD